MNKNRQIQIQTVFPWFQFLAQMAKEEPKTEQHSTTDRLYM